jgi:hypothetical protein
MLALSKRFSMLSGFPRVSMARLCFTDLTLEQKKTNRTTCARATSTFYTTPNSKQGQTLPDRNKKHDKLHDRAWHQRGREHFTCLVRVAVGRTFGIESWVATLRTATWPPLPRIAGAPAILGAQTSPGTSTIVGNTGVSKKPDAPTPHASSIITGQTSATMTEPRVVRQTAPKSRIIHSDRRYSQRRSSFPTNSLDWRNYPGTPDNTNQSPLSCSSHHISMLPGSPGYHRNNIVFGQGDLRRSKA